MSVDNAVRLACSGNGRIIIDQQRGVHIGWWIGVGEEANVLANDNEQIVANGHQDDSIEVEFCDTMHNLEYGLKCAHRYGVLIDPFSRQDESDLLESVDSTKIEFITSGTLTS